MIHTLPVVHKRFPLFFRRFLNITIRISESAERSINHGKKHFGKLLTLAAIVGAAAAGVCRLQYKSFHKELDEDFHDFEDDFDDFDDAGDKEASKASDTAASERSYVSLNPEKKEAPAETPEETSEHSEESEKLWLDADVSSKN